MAADSSENAASSKVIEKVRGEGIGTPIVVAGSLYLAGEVRELLS